MFFNLRCLSVLQILMLEVPLNDDFKSSFKHRLSHVLQMLVLKVFYTSNLNVLYKSMIEIPSFQDSRMSFKYRL